MAPTYSEMKSQLQTTVDELEKYKVINKSIQAKVETRKWLKEWRDNENRRLWNQNRQLERTIRDNKKMLSNQNKDVRIYYIPWKVIMSLYYVGSCLQSYVKE